MSDNPNKTWFNKGLDEDFKTVLSFSISLFNKKLSVYENGPTLFGT